MTVDLAAEPRAAGRRVRDSLHFQLVSVAVQLAYRYTLVGWPWLFIRPLIPVASSFWIFNQVAGVQAEGGTPYVLFSLIGVAIWQCFETTVHLMTRCDRVQYFHRKRYGGTADAPMLPLLVASGVPALIELACTVVPVVALAAYFYAATGVLYVHPGVQTLLVVPAVVLAFALALGVGLVTSISVGKMRDLSLGLGYVLRFWQYATPVFYPVALIPDGVAWISDVNPMTGIVAVFRDALLGTGGDSLGQHLAPAFGLTAIALSVGLLFRRRFPNPPKRWTQDPFDADEVI
jgi:lipopolysaccharide transport system permease protein